MKNREAHEMKNVPQIAALTLILCFLTALTLPPGAGAATVGGDLVDLKWTLDDDGRLDIFIGDGYDHYMYNFNSNSWDTAAWMSRKNKIKSVVIHEGVLSVGHYAFYQCVNLKSVTLPDSVERIGQGAFCGCSSLTDINIPKDAALYIGVFEECTSLTHFEFPEGFEQVSSSLFKDCRRLKKVTFPDTITLIGEYAFYGCTSLTEAVLPDGVTYIGQQAFAGCASLKDCPIPPSVTRICNFVFSQCAITRAVLPEGITELEDGLFDFCKQLTDVELLGPVTAVKRLSFSTCTSLITFSLPETVKEIGQQAFYDCVNLETLYIRSDTVSIHEDAFQNCGKLTISCRRDSDAYAFAAEHHIPWRPLTERVLDLPEDLEEIWPEAFANLADIDAVRIPAGVKEIADDAFAGTEVLLLVPSGSPWVQWAADHDLEAWEETD